MKANSAKELIMHNSQIRNAKNIYLWLWLSPLVTLPTLLFLVITNLRMANSNSGASLIALVPALWHLLILSFSALGGETEFVRWHGRQALALAAIRTLVFSTTILFANSIFVLGMLAVGLIWLIGNIWGRDQAKRGDCALMRWAGRGAVLPLPIATESNALPAAAHRADALVQIIRTSRDEFARGIALDELRKLGLVEEF